MDVARFSPTDYLTMLERFVTNGDVFEFETNVQMDFPRAINYDPILLYLQRLMKDPLIQSRVLGSRLAGKVFYEVVGRFVLECLHDQKFINQMAIGEQTQMEKMMEWSMQKKQDTWQSLLQQLGEKARGARPKSTPADIEESGVERWRHPRPLRADAKPARKPYAQRRCHRGTAAAGLGDDGRLVDGIRV